jgi:RNA polymerase sigma-70 factor (ECF subfamily)
MTQRRQLANHVPNNVKDSPPGGHVLRNGHLVAAALTGDVAWFRDLFATHYRDLLGYAMRRLRVVEDAQDAVAEVLSVAWRRRGDVPDDPVEQRMWLFGVARRVVANHRRGEVRRSRLAGRLESVGESIVVDLAFEDEESDLTLALAALDALSPPDREILLLAVWEELTVAQIATVMGLTKPNVSLRLHRAKARLRREFLRLMKDHHLPGHVNPRRAHGEVARETSS